MGRDSAFSGSNSDLREACLGHFLMIPAQSRSLSRFLILPGENYSQLLTHEVMLVSCRMVLKRSKDAISEFFVKGSGLKTKGIEECIGAPTLDCIKLGTLHQFLAKATAARGLGHGKRSNV